MSIDDFLKKEDEQNEKVAKEKDERERLKKEAQAKFDREVDRCYLTVIEPKIEEFIKKFSEKGYVINKNQMVNQVSYVGLKTISMSVVYKTCTMQVDIRKNALTQNIDFHFIFISRHKLANTANFKISDLTPGKVENIILKNFELMTTHC